MREQKHLKTASRLKECLDEHEMKAIDLADRIGVNRSAITHYTNGISCPKNDTAQKIADVFGVNPLWIMELSDEKYVEKRDLTAEDYELINDFHKADQSTRDRIKRILDYAKKILNEEHEAYFQFPGGDEE